MWRAGWWGGQTREREDASYNQSSHKHGRRRMASHLRYTDLTTQDWAAIYGWYLICDISPLPWWERGVVVPVLDRAVLSSPFLYWRGWVSTDDRTNIQPHCCLGLQLSSASLYCYHRVRGVSSHGKWELSQYIAPPISWPWAGHPLQQHHHGNQRPGHTLLYMCAPCNL